MGPLRGKPGHRLGGDLADQRGRGAPRLGAPEAGRQADDLEPLGWRHQQRPVRSAGDAQDRQRPAPGACQRQHATGHLAVERRRIEVALARHHQVGSGPSAPPGRRGPPRGRSPARSGRPARRGRRPTLPPRPHRPRPSHRRRSGARTALRPRPGAAREPGLARAWRPSGGRTPRRLRGTAWSRRTPRPARPRAAPPASPPRRTRPAPRRSWPNPRSRSRCGAPRVAGRHEELSDAGRVGADGIVTMRPWQQAASRRTGHLDDRRRAVDRLEHAPLRVDRRTEWPADDGGRGVPPSASRRPSPPSDIGTSSAVQPAPLAAPPAAAAASAADTVPRNLSGAATRWGTGTKLAKGRTR